MPLGQEPARHSTQLLITNWAWNRKRVTQKNSESVQPKPATGKSPNMSVCYISAYQARNSELALGSVHAAGWGWLLCADLAVPPAGAGAAVLCSSWPSR